MGLLGTDTHGRRMSRLGMLPTQYWCNISDIIARLVLRTHTTAISAAMLHKLAGQRTKDGRVPPARYFSIDRVFR